MSQNGNPLIRISNNYGKINGKKLGFYFIARQHSGETPGSWVLDGLLKYLAKMNCRDILVWEIPLSNIDGVLQGDYGNDNFPYDLNRAWRDPPMRHETLVFQRDINNRWKSRCKPTLILDFHAPGGTETDGAYFS